MTHFILVYCGELTGTPFTSRPYMIGILDKVDEIVNSADYLKPVAIWKITPKNKQI